MAKMGFSAKEVWAMPSLEVGAWVRTYMESLGVKPTQAAVEGGSGDSVVYSKRIPLRELKR
ncbi:hypothetical protein [Conservatibacter flavescens]|uniref:hypothetical protein n=1 Tax=Conservatibacter flavescens TaxID=28161 RepID=UPI000C227D63|nr:hypothetical protein [Conservatibacter flavescens]